jgi:CRISPR-associated exonuclease Cas4
MIIEIIKINLPEVAKIRSKELDDRTIYVGVSEVKQCICKTVRGKIDPQPISLAQHIIFERGHLAENIIHESLLHYCQDFNQKAGRTVMTVTAQVEVLLPGEENIRAHIDFVLKDIDKNKMTVIEVKSASMVSEPYDSWVSQCTLQQGMLAMSYPEVEIDGCVLCIDLKTGDLKEFKVDFDNSIFKNLIKRAEYILSLLNTQDIDFSKVPTEQSVLCGYCAFQADCSEFQDKGNIPEDLKELIKEYFKINTSKKGLDKKVDALKEQITSYGPFKANIDGIKANYTVSQMMSLDIKALKANEPELANMYSSPKEYTRLSIS